MSQEQTQHPLDDPNPLRTLTLENQAGDPMLNGHGNDEDLTVFHNVDQAYGLGGHAVAHLGYEDAEVAEASDEPQETGPMFPGMLSSQDCAEAELVAHASDYRDLPD